MKILPIKDIEHFSLVLRPGKPVIVEDRYGRRYVRRGWAIDVNNVMKDEPQAEETPAPESAGEDSPDKKTGVRKKKTKTIKGGEINGNK